MNVNGLPGMLVGLFGGMPPSSDGQNPLNQEQYLPALKELHEIIASHEKDLKQIQEGLSGLIPNSSEARSAYNHQTRREDESDGDDHQASSLPDGVRFFLNIHEALGRSLGQLVSDYQTETRTFLTQILPAINPATAEARKAKPRKKNGKNGETRPTAPHESTGETGNGNDSQETGSDPPEGPPGRKDAILAQRAHGALHNAISNYISTKGPLQSHLEKLNSYSRRFNQFLQARFTKPEEPAHAAPGNIVIINPNQQQSSPYIKIRLINDNPVLTDVLLNLVETLPTMRANGATKSNGPEKDPRGNETGASGQHTIALAEAADRILALANPTMLGYLNDPSTYFQRAGDLLERYTAIFNTLEPMYQALFKAHHPSKCSDSPQAVEEVIARKPEALQRACAKFKGSDFDPIDQRPGDVLPANSIERAHFALREKTLMLLYEGISEISQITNPKEREERAQALARDAAGLKEQIRTTLAPPIDWRLAHNQETDNEYYIAKQGEMGKLQFVREPTPRASLERIIGKSFDQPKAAIKQIKTAGNYPLLMEATAPGRKITSNLLIIGAYGCGKSEFARAVCADPDVIGATVSVTGILTAFAHETPNNLRRAYDEARKLRAKSGNRKQVLLVMDEIEAFFSAGSNKGYGFSDMKQVEKTFLEILDGMEEYNGINTIAMSNNVSDLPRGMFRRFRDVCVVGELTQPERATLLRGYLEDGLPVQNEAREHYMRWAGMLDGATGNIVQKCVGELHRQLLMGYIEEHPDQAEAIQQEFAARLRTNGGIGIEESTIAKQALAGYRTITVHDIDSAVDLFLARPDIRGLISDAKQLYREAKTLFNGAQREQGGFGLPTRVRSLDFG